MWGNERTIPAFDVSIFMLSKIVSWLTNFLSIQTLIFRFIFSSHLDEAIEKYDRERPIDLAADANSVISEKEAANSSPFIKYEKKIDDIFNDLDACIGTITNVIGKKIRKWVDVNEHKLFICLINSNYFVSDQYMLINIRLLWQRS